MEIKKDCKYSMLIPTSIGVRLSPEDRQPAAASNRFTLQATSAESNAGNVAASLGQRVKLLTKFVVGSPIAEYIKSELRRRNMEFEGLEEESGGPWGYRHQFNIADSGFGARGPRVYNDRAGEVGRIIRMDDFDIDRLLKEEGAAILHMSGLLAALSAETGAFCVALADEAKKCGTLVSFDLNFRHSFWEGRQLELREVFSSIASKADILIGNEEDFQLALDIEGPPAGGENLDESIDAFKEMMSRAGTKYPNVTLFAMTLREVLSANEHMWGAITRYGGGWYTEAPKRIHVFDRIGGGDGFVGGLLYGLLKGMTPERCLGFGWAAGALAVSVATDYASPESEEQIWDIFNGNARIKR
jgi:2-dehydro-3-deoxygluconokinase